MVPEYESSLVLSFSEHFQRVFLVQFVGIFHKYGIEMAARHVAGDLCSWNHQQTGFLSRFQGQLVSPVAVKVGHTIAAKKNVLLVTMIL